MLLVLPGLKFLVGLVHLQKEARGRRGGRQSAAARGGGGGGRRGESALADIPESQGLVVSEEEYLRGPKDMMSA